MVGIRSSGKSCATKSCACGVVFISSSIRQPFHFQLSTFNLLHQNTKLCILLSYSHGCRCPIRGTDLEVGSFRFWDTDPNTGTCMGAGIPLTIIQNIKKNSKL